jgi:signal transduction histidine kinase
LGAGVALAFGAGAVSFALVALVLSALGSDVLVLALGVACVAAVVGVARAFGIAYAAPAAISALLAFDWYRFPPTHPLEFPDSDDLAELFAYLSVGVLVGELAAYASRRADVSEAARSRLAEEQSALRRVATLVAQGVSPEEIFAAVAQEAAALLDLDAARIVRYEDADEVDQLAGWGPAGRDPPPLGRVRLEGTSVTSEVRRTGRAARIDYASAGAAAPEFVQRFGIRSAVGAPIVVDGRLWGAMVAWSLHRAPLPEATASRLADFTGLIATAISNTASREQLARLAEEQAALRRVATLVARAVPPTEVFAAVGREVGRLLDVDATHMGRYEPDGTATCVASWSREGDELPIGTRMALDGDNVSASVLGTGRPERIDSYENASGSVAAALRDLGIRSSVAAPIVVEGRLWGVMVVSSKEVEPLPADTEARAAAFTELVGAAIGNSEARAEVERLADEQAALRRVATLVAREPPPEQVFAAVAEEVGRLLRVENTRMYRYETDGTATVLADWGERDAALPLGANLTLEGENVIGMVRRTGRPGRIDDHSAATGSIGARARELGTRSAVGAPIVVEGRPWGAMIAATRRQEPLAADTESRMEEFTELVATAIANIQARSDLAASRARIVAAADDERRRVVRDLHDGAQQRLVHTTITLQLAKRALERGEGDAAALVDEALEQADHTMEELRELAHGILPAVLLRGGLRAGVEALASRMPVPVDIAVPGCRLAPAVEATAYFVVAEALTNVAKHSHAGHAVVLARIEDGALRVDVRDDGVGGARPDGTGLVGLGDRLAVLDGRLRIESPVEGGTLIAARIPLPG